jgi:hypothetical protein
MNYNYRIITTGILDKLGDIKYYQGLVNNPFKIQLNSIYGSMSNFNETCIVDSQTLNKFNRLLYGEDDLI